MSRPARPILLTLALPAVMFAVTAVAQQQVYRYVDPTGRVVYSDRPPGDGAKDLQPKRLGANYIENDALPLAARQATENYPVTLFTFACGEICTSAEGMLNRRGVPFQKVNVEEAAGAEKLKAITGELTAPVLQVGEKLVMKGFNEPRWQAMLDEAGYPKAIPQRTRPVAKPTAEATATQSATAPAAPVGPSGYPKN
jgi:glutaredoxin